MKNTKMIYEYLEEIINKRKEENKNTAFSIGLIEGMEFALEALRMGIAFDELEVKSSNY